MASQSDTLSMAAQVVDQFSKPLADLTRQLKSFSSLEQSTHQRGKRTVDEHWKGYGYTSENVKKLLTPAIEGLGLTSFAALGSITGLTAAMKTFGEHAKTLSYLRTEADMTSQQLEFMENLWSRVGISAEQTDATMVKFAQNFDQFKKHRGDFMTSFGPTVSPEITRLLTQDLPKAKDTFEAIAMVQKELRSKDITDVERPMLARTFFIPAGPARRTFGMKATRDTERSSGKVWACPARTRWDWRSSRRMTRTSPGLRFSRRRSLQESAIRIRRSMVTARFKARNSLPKG